MKISRLRTLNDYVRWESATRLRHVAHAARLAELTPTENIQFTIPGHSYPAGKEVEFLCDFQYSAGFPNVNWRERVICPETGLNNRTRAALHCFDLFADTQENDKIFIMESTTALYHYMKARYSGLVGAEYLGDSVPLGTCNSDGIRNEDARDLTFDDCSLDCVLHFDVLEHIFGYNDALLECHRVLRKGGTMMFTAPFDINSAKNIKRAEPRKDGSIHHILEPEYHGDPLSEGGILCFWHFGWELIKNLRLAGFSDAYAAIFHSEPMGYLTNQVIFFAKK